jgi:hypothetical protein
MTDPDSLHDPIEDQRWIAFIDAEEIPFPRF